MENIHRLPPTCPAALQDRFERDILLRVVSSATRRTQKEHPHVSAGPRQVQEMPFHPSALLPSMVNSRATCSAPSDRLPLGYTSGRVVSLSLLPCLLKQ